MPTTTPAGPTFLVAGAGRAGTTGLIEGLRRHPDVFVTDPKEPHYFALHGTRPDFRGPGDDRHINRTAVTRKDDYLALYPVEPRFRARGEGSVSTLYYHERSLPEIRRMNPQMRVVVLLREPVERAYSSFQYLSTSGREPLASFLDAVAAEPDRRAQNWHHLWHYTSMSRYADSLAAFRAALSPEQVGVWFYDDLDRDYAGTLGSVLAFLGLPPLPQGGQEVPRVNVSGRPRSAGLQRTLSWASDRPALRRAARTVTTWRFREAVRTRLLQRQAVPPDVVRQLSATFQDDLARVREVLGDRPDLPAWLSPRG